MAPKSLVSVQSQWPKSSQSKPTESVRATIKRHTLWVIMAPKPLVSVQSKSTKGECQGNFQTTYALDDCGSKTSDICPVTVADGLLVISISLVGATTPFVIGISRCHKIAVPYQQLVASCADGLSRTDIYSKSNEHRSNMIQHRTCCVLLYNSLMWKQPPIEFSREVFRSNVSRTTTVIKNRNISKNRSQELSKNILNILNNSSI